MFFKVAFAAAVVAAVWWQLSIRADLPAHLLNHPVISVPEIVPPSIAKEMNRIVRELKEYPTNINADIKTGYSGGVEDIGEATALLPNGKCANPLMVANLAKTRCVFAGRVDVGRHFLMTGGPDALRENIVDMTSRLQSFARYLTGDAMAQHPQLTELFSSGPFTDAAKTICPADEQVLDPFQFTLLLQIPGQTVTSHLDAPYFWGASRLTAPQWLLACMQFSGLFQKLFVNQVQVVSYLHEWSPSKVKAETGRDVGGDFIYYATKDGAVKTLTAEPGAGNLVDGSKVVHAARIYRPDLQAPRINKDRNVELVYQGDEKWAVIDRTDARNETTLATYSSDDLRISLVYRARCFRSEEDKKKYNTATAPISIDSILSVFIDDLVETRGVLPSREAALKLSREELGMLLLDTYIRYPLPLISEALIPYNYCALPTMVPWTKPIMSLFCK